MRKFVLTTEDENGNKKELSQVNNVQNGSNLTEINVKQYEQNPSIYNNLYELTYKLKPFFDVIKTTFEDILEKNGSVDVELSSEFNRVKSFIPYPAMPSTFFTILDDIIYGDWVINFVKFITIIQFYENKDNGDTIVRKYKECEIFKKLDNELTLLKCYLVDIIFFYSLRDGIESWNETELNCKRWKVLYELSGDIET